MSDQDLPAADPSLEPAGASAPGQAVRFDFQPHHGLRLLAAMWVALAIFSWLGVGCWVVAGVTLCAGWYVQIRRIRWPDDVEDFLAERGWAVRRRRRARNVETRPPIPFRPMTIVELYGGAAKILLRNWPTLVGIPASILTAFIGALGVLLYFLDAPSPVHAANLLLSHRDSVLAMVALAVGAAAAWCLVIVPTDALLILLGVQAADKVMRGLRVRFDEMVLRATDRVCAVCRLSLVYFFVVVWVMVVVEIIARHSGFYTALIPLIVVGSVAALTAGMLLSMSPIVLVIENRGVTDSFRRSIELCKPAMGRIVGIHVLWLGCAAAVAMLAMIAGVAAVIIVCPILAGSVRCLQMLVYADLRMRQEDYGVELLDNWMRNMGREGSSSG